MTRGYLLLTVATILFVALVATRTGPFTFGWVETIAFTAGAWSVWLVVRENPWTWPIGILNAAMFVWLFWDSRLYADALINVFYVATGVWGWWFWLRGGDGRAPRRIAHASWRELAIVALLAAIATIWGIDRLHDVEGAAPIRDALTASLSMAAYWLQSRKLFEGWWCWIAADLIYIPLYVERDLHLTAILYCVFLAMCFAGHVEWRRRLGELKVAVA